MWAVEAEALLAEPNNGIPTITEIKLRGRRVQDKRKLSIIQMEEERKRQVVSPQKSSPQKIYVLPDLQLMSYPLTS